MTPTKPLVITVSRQLGCGGAYIGQQLAKRLQIHYADREIIRKAAEQLEVREEDIEKRDEKTQPFWETMLHSTGYAPEFYVPINIRYAPSDTELFEAETSVIKQIAESSAAVIIGRGGFYFLKKRENCVRVYLYADKAFRTGRVMELYSVKQMEAEDMIVQSDKERAKYIDALTGVAWNDATNFDLSLNTGKIGLDKCVEVIMAYLNQL